MKHITIIVPDFAQLTGAMRQRLAEKQGHSTLSLFISKASRKKSTVNYLQALADFFHLPQLTKTSITELTAIHDNLILQNQYWLRADPVELKADLAAVYMYGNKHLTLTAAQISGIKAVIQPLLDDLQIQLHTTAENRWYLELPGPAAMFSPNPLDIIGKDVAQFLPKHTSTINWKKLQTEMQMALHQLPDNGGVNSLWFWGDGEKLGDVTVTNGYKIFSNEPSSLGLASHGKIPVAELPEMLNEELFFKNLIEGRNLIIYDRFSSAQNLQAFFTELEKFEQGFIRPLLLALKENKINKISLNFLTGTEYEFKRASFYYFWKLSSTLYI